MKIYNQKGETIPGNAVMVFDTVRLSISTLVTPTSYLITEIETGRRVSGKMLLAGDAVKKGDIFYSSERQQ